MEKKAEKQLAHKIEAILLTLSLTITGSVYIYKYVANPKIERTTVSRQSFMFGNNNYNEIHLNNVISDLEYQDVVKNIKGNKDMDQKKAEALYYAILTNDSLTTKEKKELSNLIQYFIDNKYINPDYVFNKLSNIRITEEDPTLLEQGIGATYNEDNSITFATTEERKYLLPHETLHSMDSENISYEEYGWFIEGYVCTINYEYFDNEFDGNNMKSNFIRCLCELVETDVLFKVNATGNMNYLVYALNQKGITNEMIQNLFELCKEYDYAESYGSENIKELCSEIIICFVDMYNVVYNTPEYVSNSFIHNLLKIKGDVSDINDYYYFNSEKCKKNRKKEFNRTQDELYVIMDESLKSYS